MTCSETKVLVVDDEPGVRAFLCENVRRVHSQALEAGTLAGAREQLSHHEVDALVLDHQLPDGTGLELLDELRERHSPLPVIMLTGYASVNRAVWAMRAGAFHYLEKPVDGEILCAALERAIEPARVRRELAEAREQAGAGGRDVTILGRAPAMREALALIDRVAASPATTVLVTGESGTGKDMVARAIHSRGSRSHGRFVNITCSALPATLLESELFGHERGAFTDAVQRKVGLFEQADGGTVFLDEIGEMEPQVQAKLLRFLEDRSFRRVGGNEDRRADVRVVAATNVDLRAAVREHRFREDLYYRLAVLTIALPPLRERPDDIELLALYFLDRFNLEIGRAVREIRPSALRRLQSYQWPGNVRELRNAIERAVLLSRGSELGEADFSDLGAVDGGDAGFVLPACGVNIRELERSLVEQALVRTNGNKTRAARLLGLNRDQIRYRLERYDRGPTPDGGGRACRKGSA